MLRISDFNSRVISARRNAYLEKLKGRQERKKETFRENLSVCHWLASGSFSSWPHQAQWGKGRQLDSDHARQGLK
jgi:hypothetical protein